MFTKALYYPYILIPDNLWLRRAILYWDRISPIVPWRVEQKIPKNHISKELKSRGVLDFIHPESILTGAEKELSECFLKIVTSEEFRTKIGPPEKRRYSSRIYRDKFSHTLLNELRDLYLFKEEDDDALLFEPLTGTIYMGFLASSLAKGLNLEPITDVKVYQDGFLRSNLIPSNRPTVSTSLVLEKLLPAPKGEIAVKEIIQFKEKHERELLAFRNVIRSTQTSLKAVTDEHQYNEKLDAVKDEIKEHCLVLDRKMKDNGWETVWNTVETPFKLSLQEVGVVGLVGATYSVPVAIGVLGANAVVKIVREVFHNHRVRRESILEASPYTYVFNVKKKFG